MRNVAVVLVAAGSGTRLGLGTPKAFVQLSGTTLIEHALGNVLSAKNLAQVVLVVPASHLAAAQSIAAAMMAEQVDLRVVEGSTQTRQQSIEIGLQALHPQIEIVLVHDAARALTPVSVIDRVSLAVAEGIANGTNAGVLPVMPVVDSIKRASAEIILETVDRDELRIGQTPQGFPAQALKSAYASATGNFPDDVSLYQATGGQVISVIGHAKALKITTTEDLAAAERILASYQRTGIGTDVHRFALDGRKPLVLAGIEWADEVALDGHSDGDAVAHAVVDSLLAAAGLGDIGSNFGVDRPEYSGASGEVFIAATLQLLAQNGWRVLNVSVQIIGNRPKLSSRRDAAQQRMTQLVGAPVTIGATTTDGLGFLGNSEGVAAVATALILGTQR